MAIATKQLFQMLIVTTLCLAVAPRLPLHQAYLQRRWQAIVTALCLMVAPRFTHQIHLEQDTPKRGEYQVLEHLPTHVAKAICSLIARELVRQTIWQVLRGSLIHTTPKTHQYRR